MQIIWVSSPTAKVVTVAITRRMIGLTVLGLCLAMVLLGAVFQLIGLRVAVEVAPEVAHAIGGVASVADHHRLEARYRDEVQALKDRVSVAVGRLGELEKARVELLDLLGVRQAGGIPRAPLPGTGGQGGPLRLLEWIDPRRSGLDGEINATARHVALIDATLTDLQHDWVRDSRRLSNLPAALPLSGDFYMSSGFGMRLDPITGQPSLHEGVDFVAKMGAPILATGHGTVRRSEFASDLGQVIEIEHGEGYVSRYAHLRRRLVSVGQRVQRGDPIGELGNSGRTTGAHLHYEVEHMGRLIDPRRPLASLAWR